MYFSFLWVNSLHLLIYHALLFYYMLVKLFIYLWMISLNFRAISKIFHTFDHNIINDILKIFDIMNIADSITKRQRRFHNRYFCKNFDFSNCIYDIFRIDSAQLFVPWLVCMVSCVSSYSLWCVLIVILFNVALSCEINVYTNSSFTNIMVASN